ncbi:MAG: hypothetical protein IJO26_02920 [Clostridium sp.]|nr:hypothetical protein [Clostridium sp.]
MLSMYLISCGAIDSLKRVFNNKNDYFVTSNEVDQISIQNIRDKSFKFLVTDESAIENMYKFLSEAKETDVRSELQPDYIVEIVMGEDILQFNYVVGAYEGNFYNDEISFTVSSRLDEAILQNLSIIRKPRDFEYIYYEPLLDVIDKLSSTINYEDKKVGINIKEDVDCVKYIFSTDLDNFLKKARKIAPNIDIVNGNEDEFDVIVTIKNRGHSTTIYKSNITVKNKVDNTSYYYYVFGENEYKEWEVNIYTEEDLPKDVEKNW